MSNLSLYTVRLNCLNHSLYELTVGKITDESLVPCWIVAATSEEAAIKMIHQIYGWSSSDLHVKEHTRVIREIVVDCDKSQCDHTDASDLLKPLDLKAELKTINDRLLRIEHAPPKHIELLGGPEFLELLKEEIKEGTVNSN